MYANWTITVCDGHEPRAFPLMTLGKILGDLCEMHRDLRAAAVRSVNRGVSAVALRTGPIASEIVRDMLVANMEHALLFGDPGDCQACLRDNVVTIAGDCVTMKKINTFCVYTNLADGTCTVIVYDHWPMLASIELPAWSAMSTIATVIAKCIAAMF